MCRVFSYIGQEFSPFEYLYTMENHFVNQTLNARHIGLQNLAGTGFCCWSGKNESIPYLYHSPAVTIFDKNYFNLNRRVKAESYLTHMRGVANKVTDSVIYENVHPFYSEEFNFAFSHNGELASQDLMRHSLNRVFDRTSYLEIKGGTDSEWIFTLIKSVMRKNAVKVVDIDIIQEVINTIKEIRERLGVRRASPFNLIVQTPDRIVATKYTFDYGVFPGNEELQFDKELLNEVSLFIRKNKESFLLASEPIGDCDGWNSIKLGSYVEAIKSSDEIKLNIKALV